MLVLGVMSGTSLDGLDLALCNFEGLGPVTYEILLAKTLTYDKEWRQELSTLHVRDGRYLCSMDVHFGRYIAFQILQFIESPDFRKVLKHFSKEDSQNILISSHGHTVFHEPNMGLTTQIGHGAFISALTGMNVICDFRKQDVALGGQGAPLVPIGDKILFGEYDACLNIGGFANVSTRMDNIRKAWDICPANFILNRWAQRLGDTMDRDGMYSAKGRLLPDVLQLWEDKDYYKKPAPKSLGREWIESVFLDQIYEDAFDPKDLMYTALEHISRRIAHDLPDRGTVLVTGGGAFHPQLIERIKVLSGAQLILPEPDLIHYKEALIFALMGYLRWHQQPNVLASVTGASVDHSSGVIYHRHS
ncbi:MAG: anhydro-N-acetylmuramic acid kinase [Thermaurantimonas sp.]